MSDLSSPRTWRVAAGDLWHMYRCVVRECFASTGNPWHTFQARLALLALHAAAILVLMWWTLLGYGVVLVARMVLHG